MENKDATMISDFFKTISDYICEEDIIEKRILIQTDDGVALNTICVRPRREGVFPVILQRNCYHEQIPTLMRLAHEYAKRGLAFVLQDCRGTGASTGQWTPNVNERNDGLATINWLTKQKWVGDIGYLGVSYLALTGWSFIDTAPEQVKTMFLAMYGTNRHVSAYQNGCFRHDILTAWAMGNAGQKITNDYIESCKFKPHYQVDEKLWGIKLDWYRDWVSHVRPDDPYWSKDFWGQLKNIPNKVTIPVYIYEGWYDHHLGSAIKSWHTLSEASKEQSTLTIADCNHYFEKCVDAHPSENNEHSYYKESFFWFYEILVNKKKTKQTVNTFVIGDNRWKRWDSYPSSTQNLTLQLQAGKNGNGSYQLRTLDMDPYWSNSYDSQVESEGCLSYEYDPENPVPSKGGESLFYSQKQIGSILQDPIHSRSDTLSFETMPIQSDLVIVGSIKANLTVTSETEDTAFCVKVMEVNSKNEPYNIRTGISTLEFGKKQDNSEKYLVSIEMWDIVWKIAKGSKIRIDITSSDFPQYNIHTNYPGIWSKQEKSKKTTQTVFVGKQSKSELIIPIHE